MDSSIDIFDETIESDFVDISLALEFTMDSQSSWNAVEIEDTVAVIDDDGSTQGVNEAPLTSTPKKGLSIVSLGKFATWTVFMYNNIAIGSCVTNNNLFLEDF